MGYIENISSRFLENFQVNVSEILIKLEEMFPLMNSVNVVFSITGRQKAKSV